MLTYEYGEDLEFLEMKLNFAFNKKTEFNSGNTPPLSFMETSGSRVKKGKQGPESGFLPQKKSQKNEKRLVTAGLPKNNGPAVAKRFKIEQTTNNNQTQR